MVPVQKHHEIGQNRVAVDAARADLAHQVHAHGVAAEGEEGAVAERKDAAEAPDQVDRQREQRIGQVLADQRHRIGRHVIGAVRGHREIEEGDGDRDREQDREHRNAPAIEAIDEEAEDHASTALPFSANRPRGRFWMKRMIRTRTMILPTTAPANGSRSLLTMPSEKAPTSVPQRLPTPPKTTTMKESMM